MDSEIIFKLLDHIVELIGVLGTMITGGICIESKKKKSKGGQPAPPWIHSLFVFCIALFFVGIFITPKKVNSKANDGSIGNKDIAAAETQDAVTPESNTIITESTVAVGTENENTLPSKEDVTVPYVEIGSTREFGEYEQDNKDFNGPEPIKWIALTQDNDHVLIISVSGLKSLPYYKGNGTSDWESSSIRGWLNGSFYQSAFSIDDKKNIITSSVMQHKNEFYPHCEQGDDTTDSVFLLSLEEYRAYIHDSVDIDDKYSKGIPSDSVAADLKESINDGTYWWWLRTSARNNTHACAVTGHGEINDGNTKIQSIGLIRPAMWVDATWWNELQ